MGVSEEQYKGKMWKRNQFIRKTTRSSFGKQEIYSNSVFVYRLAFSEKCVLSNIQAIALFYKEIKSIGVIYTHRQM